ncbi:unnamed protein product [Blepharisma stoltei]|uniref:Uncharacterized protein n=1 Tax=Blepharisma stoltei TaxID=1481888 RepID=A0AAU9JWX0_9CILI|nr:unnamed protein product [Blepharisma stoltei]
MDQQETVRPGLLGVLDAAIKYFDPSQSNISEEAKAKLLEAERSLQLILTKLRDERDILRDKFKSLEEAKAKAEHEYFKVKINYLRQEQLEQTAENKIFNLQGQILNKEKELDGIIFKIKYSKNKLASEIGSQLNFEEELEGSLTDKFLSPPASNKSSKTKENLMKYELKLDDDLKKARKQIAKMEEELKMKNQMLANMNSKMNVEMFEKKRVMLENKQIFAEKLQMIRGPANPNEKLVSSSLKRTHSGKVKYDESN